MLNIKIKLIFILNLHLQARKKTNKKQENIKNQNELVQRISNILTLCINTLTKLQGIHYL